MKQYVNIKCSKCGKKYVGQGMSFDELAREKNLIKSGKSYSCKECPKVKKEKTLFDAKKDN